MKSLILEVLRSIWVYDPRQYGMYTIAGRVTRQFFPEMKESEKLPVEGLKMHWSNRVSLEQILKEETGLGQTYNNGGQASTADVVHCPKARSIAGLYSIDAWVVGNLTFGTISHVQQASNEIRVVNGENVSTLANATSIPQTISDKNNPMLDDGPDSVKLRSILNMVWRKLVYNPNTYASILGLIWASTSYRILTISVNCSKSLKARSLLSKVIREKLCSYESDLERLQEELATLIRNREALKDENAKLQMMLGCAIQKENDLQLVLKDQSSTICCLVTDLEESFGEAKFLREDALLNEGQLRILKETFV